MTALTFKEFSQIVNHVKENNSPFGAKGNVPLVKYIDPVFDMRTNTVFSIQFRTMGQGDRRFVRLDINGKTMYDQIMEWLTTDRTLNKFKIGQKVRIVKARGVYSHNFAVGTVCEVIDVDNDPTAPSIIALGRDIDGFGLLEQDVHPDEVEIVEE